MKTAKVLGALLSIFLCVSSIPAAPAAAEEVISAAQAGDLARVRELLAQDRSLVKSKDPRACTPLHFAINGGYGEVAGLLLDSGADLEARDADGDTPLMWAAAAGKAEMARLLIGRGADPRTKNGRGGTTLHYAVNAGSRDTVDALVAVGADLNAQGLEGNAPLHRAVLGNRIEIARLLMQKGAKTGIKDSYGRTPLLLVARETGNAEMAAALIGGGADIGVKDNFGDSPLVLAAWRGFGPVVDLLIEKGAKLPGGDRQRNEILIQAASKGLARLFALLKNKGADLKIRNDQGGSLLHSAAAGGSREIAETLIASKLGVNEQDRYGWTPLHYAAARGRKEVAELLIGGGADPNRKTLAGKTPYSLAAAGERAGVVQALKARGADEGPPSFPELKGRYLGQNPPGNEAAVFALDIVSSNEGEHGTVTFSPDGTEAYWSSFFMIADAGYSSGGILSSKVQEGRWTSPQFPSFASSLDDGNDVPFFSPDGRKLFFMSRRPLQAGGRKGKERIWVMERAGTGWSDPKPVGEAVNSMEQHWQISVSAAGTLYFSSVHPGGRGMGDIYVSRLIDGVYAQPVSLGDVVNTEFAEGTPFIAPDERYLIFSRLGPREGYGATDLYIAFRDGSGGWTAPLNMGAAVNSPGNELCPIVTSDGKFLFFTSSRTGVNNVYWINTDIIEELRRKSRGK